MSKKKHVLCPICKKDLGPQGTYWPFPGDSCGSPQCQTKLTGIAGGSWQR